jgi:hypothetical protein
MLAKMLGLAPYLLLCRFGGISPIVAKEVRHDCHSQIDGWHPPPIGIVRGRSKAGRIVIQRL